MGCSGSSTKEDKNSHSNTNTNNNLVIFVLGGPGSGKGTQCAKLKEKHHFVHISTGELLREEQEKNGPEAEYIKATLAEGKLVKSDILVKLVQNKINQHKNTKFLLDGFPRSQENIESWNSIINKSVNAPAVLYFDCSDETMTKRILGRALTSGRIDDNEEAIKKRLEVFHHQTVPVVKAYEKLNTLIKINCEGNPDDVFVETDKALKERKIVS